MGAKRITTTLFLILLLALTGSTACSSSQESAAPAPTASPAPAPTTPPTATEAPAEPQTIEDVQYAAAVDPEARDESLNITYLPGSQAGKPVVIWAHGSALDRSSGRILAKLLAREGYVVLAIDWRDVVTANRDPGALREALEDAACALRFSASEAGQYGADPGKVIWTGFSAGAWLGSMISLGEGDLQGILDEYAVAHGGPPQRVRCTAADDPAQIVAFVPGAGAYPGDFWLGNGEDAGWTEAFAPAAAYTAIGHNPELKVRLIHGEDDSGVDTSFAAAERFAATLQEAGYDVALLPQAGGHESFQTEIIATILALPEP